MVPVGDEAVLEVWWGGHRVLTKAMLAKCPGVEAYMPEYLAVLVSICVHLEKHVMVSRSRAVVEKYSGIVRPWTR